MEDYISILLEALEQHDLEYLGWEYFIRSDQAMEEMETLKATLSGEQKKIFEKYEGKQAAAAAAREAALTRQAFLLAREIFR